MKTLVLGLGNPYLTDDGIGVLIAESVRQRLPADPSIEISELSVGGLTLMESMIGYDRAILIDALQTANNRPGTIHKMSLEDLEKISPTQHSSSPHDASLITAMKLGKRMKLPLPEKLTIFAIEVENVTDFGDVPTPSVSAVIPEVTTSVIEEIRNL